jgi:nitrogen fixation NifU-like protein|tara:strand:- start:518 stop:916 length:399 start_codon:yes stop_codon:yes gene_type:complete
MDLEILKIASDTINHKKLDDCTHKSKQKNPICGDEMEVGVKILENQILDFAYQCKSCIYCQASASVLSKFSINNTINNINEIITFVDVFFESNNAKFPKEWKKLEILFNKKNISRKECILLPFKTLAKALKT